MKIIKKVQFWKCSAGANDPDRAASLFGSVYLLEDLDSLEYPIATWPSSLLLAGFIVQNVSLFRGKTILELGAGTSLPSLLCAHQAVGAAKVFVSERPDEPDLHSLIQKEIDLNLCSHICTVTSLDWHRFKPSHFINLPIDIILGADVFYCDEDFTSLFSMLNELFECNPQALFIISYHIRSERRTIWPWLEKYEFSATEIDRADFLSSFHDFGFCTVRKEKDGQDEDDVENLDVVALPQFHDIKLFVIRKG